MEPQNYRSWPHRFALLTCAVALLPVIVGALTTTLNAGMAFPDWPTSDGYFMLTYPWLADLFRGAIHKFCEHSHRLAGMLIGFVSILLTIAVWRCENRRWVRWAALGVLLSVCLQGVLGGGRVRLDARMLAMIHGSFAALVLGLMVTVAVVTSRRWFDVDAELADSPPNVAAPLLPLAVLALTAIVGQYILGGFLRHFGSALHEHLAGAVATTLIVLATVIAAHRTRVSWLRQAGWMLLALVVVQVLLGLAAWVTRFGFPPLNYVAQANSAPQIVVRTSHAVVGMLTFATSVALLVRTLRVRWLVDVSADGRRISGPSYKVAAMWSAEGGAR